MNTPFVEYAFAPKRTDGGDLWPPLLALADGREFITLLGGAAAWPVVARAQQLTGNVGEIGTGHGDN